MDRHDEILNAYHYLGKEATFYDGMITCSTLPGKAVCKLVWNMDLTKIFCANDDRCYGNLPGLEFRRTGTLGTGASRCDFYMKKR